MKMRMQGYSLIEFMVYLVLLAFFVMLTFFFVTSFYSHTTSHTKVLKHIVDITNAKDILLNDIKGALSNSQWWEDDELLIWRLSASKEDVQWRIVKNKLVRTTGRYNYKTKKWKERVNSTVLYDVDRFSLVAHQDDQTKTIVLVTGSLECKGHSLLIEAPLFNRVV